MKPLFNTIFNYLLSYRTNRTSKRLKKIKIFSIARLFKNPLNNSAIAYIVWPFN